MASILVLIVVFLLATIPMRVYRDFRQTFGPDTNKKESAQYYRVVPCSDD